MHSHQSSGQRGSNCANVSTSRVDPVIDAVRTELRSRRHACQNTRLSGTADMAKHLYCGLFHDPAILPDNSKQRTGYERDASPVPGKSWYGKPRATLRLVSKLCLRTEESFPQNWLASTSNSTPGNSVSSILQTGIRCLYLNLFFK